MILQLCILGIVVFFAPLMPPILSPLGYSLTGVLLAQKANPRILSVITVGVGTITAMIIRTLQNHIIERLTLEEKIKGNNIFARSVNMINSYFRKQEKIAKISLRREKYIETRTGRTATFLFAVFCFLPVLPDIIGTRILYKKIRFPYFILAVIIGKSISHIPFIFLGKSILQLLHLQI
ncbi:MAG: hypothetical protein WC875_01175 [Candidatus Absconditabacterales bacterium]